MSDLTQLLLNEHEAADALKISVSTLRRDRADGRLGISFITIGKSIRYPIAALQQWVAGRAAPAAPTPASPPPARRGRPRKAATRDGVAK